MYYFKKIALVCLMVSMLLQAGSVFAAGNISATLKFSQFLNTDLDSNLVKDFINWMPTNGGATVGDATLTGYIWGDTVGWINLNPSSAGVTNSCSGVLGGYAWGQNTGWVNFAPTMATGLNQPKIDISTGNITGTVWSQNYGWITLNSSNGTYPGLNTDWRPSVDCGTQDYCPSIPGIQPEGSTCGGSPGTDICLNIEGPQYSVPTGFYKVPATPGVQGDCFESGDPDNDICLNIDGIQLVVPNGYTKSPALFGVPGTCTEDHVITTDYCPNIPDNQFSVPLGMHKNTQGDCVDNEPGDVCPNIDGIQSSIPSGKHLSTLGNCIDDIVLPPTDACPGIPGNQASTADCPPQPDGDACPGIPGNQTSITDCPPPGPVDVCPDVAGVQTSTTQCLVEGGTDDAPSPGGTSFLGAPLTFLKSSNIGWVAPALGLFGLLSSIPGLVTRFGNLLLTFFLARKKTRGVVFDSKTKEPLDPVYVSVIDVATNQEVANAITDMEGRFGFVLKQGTYKVVVNKTHYQFPSVKMQGRTEDAVYDHLYFGEAFTVQNEEEVVTMNVPMDAMDADWNQQEKRRMNILRYLIENQKIWGTIFEVLYVIGFVVSLITTYYYPVSWNILMIVLYVVIAAVQFFGFGPISVGKITKDGMPLKYAVVRIFNVNLNREVAHKVTSELGGYFVLVPKADYYITIDQMNADGSYTKIFTSTAMHAEHGMINKSFNL